MAKSGLIAIVADVHLHNYKDGAKPGDEVGGINSRGRACLDVFARALRVAIEHGADDFVVAGDLFQTAKPAPALIAEAIRIIGEASVRLRVVVVPGNHDMLDATSDDGNTAVAPLLNEATIVKTAVTLYGGGMAILSCPFQSAMPMSKHVATSIAEAHGAPDVFVGHVGVVDDLSPPWLSAGRDVIHVDDLALELKRKGIPMAFVGHHHKHARWDRKDVSIVQVGTLCPATYSDDGAFPSVGGMALYDGESVRMVEIPGPRFGYSATATEENETTSAEGQVIRTRPIVQKVATTGQVTGPLPTVDDAGGALSAYVERMTLDEGIERDAVRTVVEDIWSKTNAQ